MSRCLRALARESRQIPRRALAGLPSSATPWLTACAPTAKSDSRPGREYNHLILAVARTGGLTSTNDFARAHGMWTYEPRQGRKAATAVCSASAVVTLAFHLRFMIYDLRLMAKNQSARKSSIVNRQS